ncbi:F0F1 ATP synthase subunit A [Maribacter polysiphoniae]|uniref:ATP synthase subunit a n=1 Tax=Maribacter polysiphoniae TaxID=429344 RepID=A0A316E9M3_9FLAO|nr:F0F1 ATP synthase subunit A [Maribacter polysiphoniae]MBD1259986.1 F0F1 ATP synthase subunit A [Maribacter polysiphoniae]PWK25443.1 F-type H+-transporting ATPase subunit a [Maribacter polysiphoniae]
MRKPFLLKFLLAAILLFGNSSFANEKEVEKGKDKKTEIKEFIEHHLQDSHYFNFYGTTDEHGKVHHVGLPLPVILWDNGLKVFSSSKFHHGEEVAEVDGNHYVLYHSKIYKTDAEGTISYDGEHHPTNVRPLDFSITKSVVMMIVTGLLLLWLFSSLAKSYAKNNSIPTGMGRFFEPIVLYIRDDIAIANIGEKKYKRYMPFLLTVFFFIWFLNMFGLTPLGVNVTGNIAVTTALALLVFIITNLTGTKDYWKHVFDPLGDGMPWYGKIIIYIILVPIEILGLFIKPFALLIRLYANMTAGHVVLMSLVGLIFIFKSWVGGPLSFGLSFAISLIEVLVALLQAYIFTMLAALYFGFASEEHDPGHEFDDDAELAH